MELHFLNVFMSLVSQLGAWDWNSAFHKVLTAYFFLGCIAQFILLIKNKFSWVPTALLFVGVVACEVAWLLASPAMGEAVNVVEAFLFAAAFGVLGGCCVYIFWELFKRKDPNEEDDRWLVNKKKK